MIGWLQGQVQDLWQQSNRCGVVLAVAGVGYEVQLTRRQFAALPSRGASLELHIHQAIREDGWWLFGFGDRQERDLFRELIAVSGVGPQVALALLAELEPQALVVAIVQADLRLLARAQGVGKRTAERLAVELRERLQQRFSSWPELAGGAAAAAVEGLDGATSVISLTGSARDDVHLTLTALGYEPLEIQRALRAVAALADQGAGEALGSDPEAWIRGCLRWLSRDAA
ncbi:MAG: Holliday junction branch migration protein RuvA [Cyanobacteriota bacterium]|nr:Holliday junction branch migration protein RuvA [Cyanobacteriota bacterium]